VEEETLPGGKMVSWSGYHASKQQQRSLKPGVSSFLPLFQDESKSVAKIRHSMNVIKKRTEHLNPGQVPVIAVDQPLFAVAKQIQWNWPQTHGEQNFAILLGGLHIEMVASKMLGDCWEDILERFIVLLYDRTCPKMKFNEARKMLFAQKGRSLELIPPTRAALVQHVKRAVYQGEYCWGQATTPMGLLPSPIEWGWLQTADGWKNILEHSF
jgi:hypothetical protein